MYYTFQDFAEDLKQGAPIAVGRAVAEHKTDRMLLTAMRAEEYDHQRNTTIREFVRWLYTMDGQRKVDPTATNNRICSNFFNRLNTQRVTYSLGNGVTFSNDSVKKKLGETFDTRLRTAGYDALIHGVSFIFWNVDHMHVFPLTEFAPLWDEETGALRAGVRYWQVDPRKPVIAVLYEEDGFTRLKGNESGTDFVITEEKKSYRIRTRKSAIDAEPEIIGEENYGVLPIIPLYGSRLKQSTLVGLQSHIDAYDLVMSGFANDLEDCAEIYWIVSNAGGMSNDDLARFRDRLKAHHIANVADADEVSVTPYTQEIPTNARQAFLAEIRSAIYEAFGALDVHAVAAGATNDHIDAAYQPMDENADDFEYQVIDAVQQLLKLIGIEDTPIFKRNRVSNQKEQVDMVIETAQYLDDETILSKLPFLTPDEIKEIMRRKEEEDTNRLLSTPTDEEDENVNGENGYGTQSDGSRTGETPAAD